MTQAKKTFEDVRIDLQDRSGVEVQTTCPQCSHTRKKAKGRCLSVNTIEGVWCCHHCGWSGSLKAGEESRSQPPRRIVRPSFEKPSTVPEVLHEWFARRGITESIVGRYGIALQCICRNARKKFRAMSFHTCETTKWSISNTARWRGKISDKCAERKKSSMDWTI